MIRVAVTGLNATDNPAPGVAVARALREADPTCRTIGLAYDLLDPGNYASAWFDDVFLVPYPSQGHETLQARLETIIEAVRPDVVIPTLDSELPGFLALEEWLAEHDVRTFLPSRAQLELRSKLHLAELGVHVGLRVPDTVVLADASDLYELDRRLPYPIVVKGVFYGARVCYSLDEALAAYHDVLVRWGGPVLAQQVVRGVEIDVAALGDGQGGLLGAVPMRKTLLTDKGKGWAGVVVKDADALAMADRFAVATNWRGPCEIEVIRDEDGQTWLLEVNPRFPAWIYLSAAAGANLPWRAVLAALGEPVEADRHFVAGTRFVRISLDQIVRPEDFEALATAGALVDRTGRFARGEEP